MKNINWKVCFKNLQFIIQLIVSIFGPILAYAGFSAQDMISWAFLFNYSCSQQSIRACHNCYSNL